MSSLEAQSIVVIDNYDSFTYNLVHLIKEISGSAVSVIRNDQFELSEIEKFSHIVLSPGPGLPSEAGKMPEVVKLYAPTKKILGVCLGHQCIGEIFGASLSNLSKVVHGKGIETTKTVQDEVLYLGLNDKFITGRYHSWVVDKKNFPSCLEITSEDNEGYIMSLRHKEYNVRGVQFHPESVLTPDGYNMIKNWLCAA